MVSPEVAPDTDTNGNCSSAPKKTSLSSASGTRCPEAASISTKRWYLYKWDLLVPASQLTPRSLEISRTKNVYALRSLLAHDPTPPPHSSRVPKPLPTLHRIPNRGPPTPIYSTCPVLSGVARIFLSRAHVVASVLAGARVFTEG